MAKKSYGYRTAGWQVCSLGGHTCKVFRNKREAVAWFKRGKRKSAEILRVEGYSSAMSSSSREDSLLYAIVQKLPSGRIRWEHV